MFTSPTSFTVFLTLLSLASSSPTPTCEARGDQVQCAHGGVNENFKVCVWCAEEARCLGVVCGGNFSDFLARCGSTDYVDNCDSQQLTFLVNWVLIFAVSLTSGATAALVYWPRRRKWYHRCGVYIMHTVSLLGFIFTSIVCLLTANQKWALLAASSPFVLSVAHYLLLYRWYKSELRMSLCRLIMALLVLSLTLLVSTEPDAPREAGHGWVIVVAFCMSSSFSCVLVCAHATRERVLSPLGSAPLQLLTSDCVLVVGWLGSLAGAIFWKSFRESCAVVHVAVMVLMLALFMRHEVSGEPLKSFLLVFFFLEVLACALTLVFEVCTECPPQYDPSLERLGLTLDLPALVSLSLALAACGCFVFHLLCMHGKGYPRRYLQHFQRLNSRFLWGLLPDAARLVEGYVGERETQLLSVMYELEHF